MLGERQPEAGSARIGDSVDVAYYRQDLSEVPPDGTLFEIINDLRPTWTRGQVQGHLGRFDFSGDTVQRRAGSLSGGERARMALAIMMLSGANFLVFDEPTNHLDVESIEALEDAVEAYEGTVLLVSHDRALLRTLTTRIWALDQGRIDDFEGGFDEWEAAAAERKAAARDSAVRADAARRERSRRASAAPDDGRKARQSAGRTARRELERIEAEVQRLEARVQQLTTELADPALYVGGEGAATAARLAREGDTARAKLASTIEAWERAQAEVERLG
jgi:ATP-binding cassette subfamily F protein 3